MIINANTKHITAITIFITKLSLQKLYNSRITCLGELILLLLGQLKLLLQGYVQILKLF